ncbi:DinB family protein [Filobacillus milosensis]|nr:DinB family protein [Filobacillus milosensis]
MNQLKKEILNHQQNSIDFVRSLVNLSEKEWRTPIEEGKWSIAEIVAHFKPWDEFITNQRIPFLITNQSLPNSPNVDELNKESALFARKESKQTIINNFVKARTELYEATKEISDEWWEKTIIIKATTLSLYDYFNGLAQHDSHHSEQIKQYVEKNLN